MILYVQFADDTEEKIIGVFGSPQNPDYWTNMGEVEDTDPRYLAFIHPAIDTVAINEVQKSDLMKAASLAMTPVFMALQLGEATDDETVAAKAWRAYYVALQAVDVTVDDPEWPVSPA